MAVSDTEKLDTLWKRIIGGVTKTASSLVKTMANETIASPLPVFPSAVWKDGDTIPTTPPSATTTLVQVYKGATAIRMTNDPTSPANIAWLAMATYGNVATRLTKFIPFSIAPGYSVAVYIGNPNGGPAARIFPDTTGEEWVFDYMAGVLIFDTAVPANKTATIGSGTVSVAANGIYIEAYQYIGTTGVGGDVPFIPTHLGDLSDVDVGTGIANGDVLTYNNGVWEPAPIPPLGTISTQNADNVNITGGTISNVTLTGLTVDGGTF